MKFSKPHIYFWVTALIILVFTIVFYKPDEALDINVHDTYFVIAYSHFGKLFSFLFAFIGFVYFLSKKIKLYKFITNAHILISIGCFVAFIVGQLYFNFRILKANSNFPLFDDLSSETTFFSILILLFVFAQLIFLINLFLSLTKFIIQQKNLS